MKKLLLILLSLSSFLNFAQSPSERRAAQLEKEEAQLENTKGTELENEENSLINSKAFDILKAPEKYKDESAVVLHQAYDYSYLREISSGNGGTTEDESFRKRILLQDKSAVEEFSVFYFTAVNGYLYTSTYTINVIKPDGKKERVDLTKAVETTDNVPDIFQVYQSNIKFKKIAIENLEVGDIIDYRVKSHSGYSTGSSSYIFNLSTEYPILSTKYRFTLDRGFSLYFANYNGAPMIEEGAPGKDANGRVRSIIKTFNLSIGEMEKMAKEKWSNRYNEYPSIRYAVVAEQIDNNLSTKIKEEDITNGVNSIFNPGSIAISHANTAIKTLKEKFNPKESYDKDKLIQEIYTILKKDQVMYYHGRVNGTNSYYSSGPPSGKSALGMIGYILSNTYKLKFDVIVLESRKYGNNLPKDVLLSNFLAYGIVFNDKAYFEPDKYDDYNYTPNLLYGTTATRYKKEGRLAVETGTFKISEGSEDENVTKNEYLVTINDDFESTDITLTVEEKGIFKSWSQGVFLDFTTDVGMIYAEKYNDQDYITKNTLPTRGNTKTIEEAKRKSDAKKEERLKQLKEYREKNLSETFTIKEYYENDIKIINPAVFSPTENFTYQEHFKVVDFATKAGNKIFIPVLPLFGEQVFVEDNKRKRQTAIEQNNKKTLINTLKIKIPEGYEAIGLENFKITAETEVGSFTSSAKVEEDFLIIHAKKVYKSLIAPKESWNQYLVFLDAAYDLSQKKIVLVRK